jgi:hypothetical protein
MKRFTSILTAAVLLAAIGAAPASAAFGLKDLDVSFTGPDGSLVTQAGTHPFAMTTTLGVNTTTSPETGKEIPDEETRDLRVDIPEGLVGDPMAVPRCSSADFLDIDPELILPACPNASAVGVIELKIGFGAPGYLDSPVYNLIPPPGVAAKIGFVAISGLPVTVDLGVNPEPPHNIVASVTNIPQAAFFYGSELTIWGNPVSKAHDSLRGNCLETLGSTPGYFISKGDCPVSIPERPFLTMPRSCSGPLVTGFKAESWQNPGKSFEEKATTQGMSGCAGLGFAPKIAAQPTTTAAESSSGLDFNLDVNDEGLTSPTGIAQTDIKKAVVTLPKGVTANPSVAGGLATCSPAAYAAESASSEAGAGCPEASKIGAVEVETPLLEGKLLKGSLFLASQNDNPFNTLLAIYMVIKDPELGISVKLPGKVTPDPQSGQLVTTFEDIPQFPFAHFRFHFREGARAPLVTPPACGDYETKAVFTPWSGNAPLTTTASFHIGSGAGGGPCPAGGVPPFKPGFSAGSIDNNAGSYSPFYMRLTRADGEQDMTRFDTILPPGVVGKIAGLTKCPEAAIAAAKTKAGRSELAAPSCPASSEVGHILAGAGVGPALTYVEGKLYLAGPFGGDPLSVVAITPAVAGPFDVGTVVVREALTLNPATAEVEVDGGASDPIPHILAGIPLKLRDLRVYADRPKFTLNPTSCEPSSTRATLFGGFADPFSAADDAPVALASRYQAANCANLGFKPRLALRLKGGTRRGAYPAFSATLNARPGDANIGKAVVTLPHSAFLEQGHIRTVCTRVQYAAKACPAGSIYGKARAITPLLDEPLEGPVYLRSSSHPLPDLVAALHGIVDVDLVGRVDSVNARIRGSFESPPDAPVTKFVLEMQGGKKGLIVNSRNLCAAKSRAIAELSGQNGKLDHTKPEVVAAGCSKKVKKSGQ